jgi:hypothetical protein
VFEDILGDYKDEIERIDKEKDQKTKQQLEEFVVTLINDEEFRNCRFSYERNRRAIQLLDELTGIHMPVHEIEALVRPAWDIVKYENRNKRQEQLNNYADLLAQDEDFKKCTNRNLRRAYTIDFLKATTDEVLGSKEIEQIADVAWSKV